MEQCSIVGLVLGGDACKEPHRYNRAFAMAEIRSLYGKLGLQCDARESQIERERLMDEVLADRPVQVGLSYGSSADGHVVVVVGETTNRNGQKFLRLADPQRDGLRLVPLENIADANGLGKWVWTWSKFEVAKEGDS